MMAFHSALRDNLDFAPKAWLNHLNSRTYNALLGLGFDTDLIARFRQNGHTVSALRSLSRVALQANYTELEIGLIQEKTQRTQVPPEIIDAVLNASDRVCCFCQDGISSRPFQIHHAVEYSKTQDNSFENLILLCPNHHQTIPKIQTPDEQKQARAGWYALVILVHAYKENGIAFPFGTFISLDYASEPAPLALIEGYKLSNATTFDLAQTAVAQLAVQRLKASPFLAIAGDSGSGKSTFARGVIGHFWKRGYVAVQFQPSSNGKAAAELLTFLSLADRDSILLLDDANTYLSEVDITSIQSAARAGAKVVCTWTREAAAATMLERHLPDWLLIDWEQLKSGIRDYLLKYETTLAPAIGMRQGAEVIRRVGLGHMDERLENYFSSFATNAKSVSEFVFLLRGGEEIIERELDVLTAAGHSEIPVLCVAVEQIAGFENMLSPQEIVERCTAVGIFLTPPITPAWVASVLQDQVRRGRIQESRGYFTTIHRDWAARLIDRVLATERSSADMKRLLSPEFEFSTVTPERCMRLCSWLWYTRNGGKWVKDVLAGKTPQNWSALVGRAASKELGVLGFLADRMHLLFQSPTWTATAAAAFRDHEAAIQSLLGTATPGSWPSLKSISWAISAANPEMAKRLWTSAGIDPKTTAVNLESTHPDYYDTLSWYFGSVNQHSPDWVKEVGNVLDVDRMLDQLKKISLGEASTVFAGWETLRKLGVPFRRSMIRKFAEAFGKTLTNCPLRSFHIGFPPFFDPTWLVYNDDVEKALVGIDTLSLAQQLATASPREWRRFSDLTMFAIPAVAKLVANIIDQIDVTVLAQSVARTAVGHEYELRCLLWSLSRASGLVRKEIALALYQTVVDACHRSSEERFQLLRAFYALDSHSAKTLAADLSQYSPPEADEAEREEARREKKDAKERWKDATRLEEKYADLERSGDDYVFDPWADDQTTNANSSVE